LVKAEGAVGVPFAIGCKKEVAGVDFKYTSKEEFLIASVGILVDQYISFDVFAIKEFTLGCEVSVSRVMNTIEVFNIFIELGSRSVSIGRRGRWRLRWIIVGREGGFRKCEV
jgi:hypothetical protein